MFRVFDVSRCHPPSELADVIPRKRISLPTGRIAISTSRSHSFPARCASMSGIFFVLMQCDEKSLPNINSLVGRTRQPVRH
jgi:hypothetical protein